ncbi:hypothetical protein LTR04_002242 [Oleoguttula sp. CCFEE 6159]|nr:hypothetical protein LTR04_002242 [Oleoguttula sp. CCFEE 6159]
MQATKVLPNPPPMPSTLPPNPCLVAVLLVIKSRAGPRFVFHYPPTPSEEALSGPSHRTTSSLNDDDSESSSTNGDDAWSSDNDDDVEEVRSKAGKAASKAGTAGTAGTAASTARRTARGLRETDPEEDEGGASSGSESEKRDIRSRGNRDDTKDGGGERPWERVLGYTTGGLEKLLCPPKAFNKKRFEVSLKGLVFLGCPMFVREDGAWKKRRERRKRATGEKEDEHSEDVKPAESPEARLEHNDYEARNGVDVEVPVRTQETDSNRKESPGMSKSFGSQSAVSENGSDAKSASTTSAAGDQNAMTMFNVVFVLNPPALEYQLRVQEMYDHVVKKFAYALKPGQARSDYVWNESKKVWAIKLQAKENNTPLSLLWSNAMASSSLARSMATVYDAISTSAIANVTIERLFNTFLRIPQAISTPYVPAATEPQMPGLWLTTASLMGDDDAGTMYPSPCCALLLLEDADKLLKEVKGDAKELSAHLTCLVRNSTPTKSLLKLSAGALKDLELSDIQFVAHHLIYWRRARAIPPLHQRDTYIVSPNADMRQLRDAIPVFAARFPTLPNLPKMLNLLSGTPRPYSSFIPSRDHRPAYLEILAWLLRGGWVTQLRTFAWVRVSAEVKAAVAVKMEREAVEAVTKGLIQAHGSDAGGSKSTSSRRPSEAASDATRAGSIASPRLGGLLSPPRADSDAESVSSGRTAVPGNFAVSSPPPSRPSPLPSNLSTPLPSRQLKDKTSQDALNHHIKLPVPKDPSAYESSLVLSPHKADALESAWLSYISQSFSDAELRGIWPVFQKYFDGSSALEEIAAREGMKRSRVWALLAKLREEGCLGVVRHW